MLKRKKSGKWEERKMKILLRPSECVFSKIASSKHCWFFALERINKKKVKNFPFS